MRKLPYLLLTTAIMLVLSAVYVTSQDYRFGRVVLAPSPLNVSVTDEFISGTGATDSAATIGSLGWRTITIGAAPTFTATAAATPNLGIIQFNTAVAATQGQGGALTMQALQSAGSNITGNLATSVGWEVQWIFKLAQTTDTRFRIGLTTSPTAVQPTDGIWLRYDTGTGFADTTFVFGTRIASGTETTADSTIGVDTNWHRVSARSTTAGTVIFTLYDAAGAVQATQSIASVPTTSLNITAIIATDASAQKSIQLDYMSFYAPVAR